MNKAQKKRFAFFTTSPPRMTACTFCMQVMSLNGSPSTAMMSASLPSWMLPTLSSHPNRAAAELVAALMTSNSDMPTKKYVRKYTKKNITYQVQEGTSFPTRCLQQAILGRLFPMQHSRPRQRRASIELSRPDQCCAIKN